MVRMPTLSIRLRMASANVIDSGKSPGGIIHKVFGSPSIVRSGEKSSMTSPVRATTVVLFVISRRLVRSEASFGAAGGGDSGADFSGAHAERIRRTIAK